MKSRQQYIKEINKEYEDLAKKKGVKLNSNAYRRMKEFVQSRFWKDNPDATLSDYFKFMYADKIECLIPSGVILLNRIKRG